MKVGKLIESFVLLPSISIDWMWFNGERHYSVQFAWLWWYISTYKTPQELIDDYIEKI